MIGLSLIGLSIGLLIAGVFLSAFFSGNETGFYRASRIRVVMAGLDGDRVSRMLLWLFNNPTWFVATTLIGNNVANYMASLAIVLLASALSNSSAAELVMPIVFSPLLFVYGELLPKNLYYRAPNLLLRWGAPLFLFFAIVLAPVSALLWGLGKGLERIMGQSPEKIRLTLARKELQQVLEEGLEAGILLPTQRQLAQSFFLVASKPVRDVFIPLEKVRSVGVGCSIESALKVASRYEMAEIPVVGSVGNEWVGYVRTIDLLLQRDKSAGLPVVYPLASIPATEMFGEALLQMQSARLTLTRVVGEAGETLGILTLDQLTDPMLEGSMLSLRR